MKPLLQIIRALYRKRYSVACCGGIAAVAAFTAFLLWWRTTPSLADQIARDLELARGAEAEILERFHDGSEDFAVLLVREAVEYHLILGYRPRCTGGWAVCHHDGYIPPEPASDFDYYPAWETYDRRPTREEISLFVAFSRGRHRTDGTSDALRLAVTWEGTSQARRSGANVT